MKLKVKASPPELSPELESRIDRLVTELACLDIEDEPIRIGILQAAFKRAYRVNLTNSNSDMKELVRRIEDLKRAGRWDEFEFSFVAEALREQELDVDRKLREAFRGLLPEDERQIFDDLCYGDFGYLMPKKKPRKHSVRVALQRIFNYSTSKRKAYINDHIIPLLRKMNKYDFAGEERNEAVLFYERANR